MGMPEMDLEHLINLVTELRSLPKETSWVEFKVNNGDPDEIGEYVSALGNSAALESRSNAYLVWGIEDVTHDVVGTEFDPSKAKRGGEELQSWLLRMLDPRLHLAFHGFQYAGRPLVVLVIQPAPGRPIRFAGAEWVRIGSYKKKLKDFPELERALWRVFEANPFEELVALERVSATQVAELLDYPSFFQLLRIPLPTDLSGILARLESESLIVRDDSGAWNILNMGAILFAKSLKSFGRLARKAVRVVFNEGRSRVKPVSEMLGDRGYASGLQGLISFLNDRLPRNEVMGQALRVDVSMYPELAIRELVANALIHQDFSISGAGPIIEVFADRIEISNPGLPLVRTERFLDAPPRSRNESIAALMRRIGFCEERGSGIDKVVLETEFNQLPAPVFETSENSTRAVLFAHKDLVAMDRTEKVRACYLHACLRYVQRDPMTNASLRERFGIAAHNKAVASRIIAEAKAEHWIVDHESAQGKRHAKYVPFWVKSQDRPS